MINKYSRRKFVKDGLKVSAAAALYSSRWPLAFADSTYGGATTHSFDLNATPGEFQILNGAKTKMLSFASSQLLNSPSYLGPVIDVNKGDRLRINFNNQLTEPSIVHWHGLHVPEPQDGHPSYAIPGGTSYAYDFTVNNRAGLYWYHPHPHGRTGFQVYNGLAGLFVVRDQEEKNLNLPSGDNEKFFVFQDRHFDDQNQLIYVQSGHDQMMGKMGDKLLVNGEIEKTFGTKTETYRLRLLNGCNARSFRLAWSDGRPLTIIGTDGGLLESPVLRDSVLFAPGERLDLIVDFSAQPVGDAVTLQSIPLVDNGRGAPFAMANFNVSEVGTYSYKLPKQLSKITAIDPTTAVNYGQPKSFTLLPKQGIGWTIDGIEYEANNFRAKEIVKLGTTEIWEFDLTNAGMVHPMHVHGSPFQVLERIHGPFSEGLVFDDGWKDTVALLPGDKVRIIKKFSDHPGKFLLHCHILEHEDHSMMRNFKVQ